MLRKEKTQIVGIRLDYRLLHGVVATQWVPILGCNRIFIIDDIIAMDDLQKELIKLIRPANCSISVLNEKNAFNNLISGKYNGQKLYILIRKFDTLCHLLDQSMDFPSINIGMYVSADAAFSVTNKVALSENEYRILKMYEKSGCRFELQYVPSDRRMFLP